MAGEVLASYYVASCAVEEDTFPLVHTAPQEEGLAFVQDAVVVDDCREDTSLYLAFRMDCSQGKLHVVGHHMLPAVAYIAAVVVAAAAVVEPQHFQLSPLLY
jgi:hypothetical protein